MKSILKFLSSLILIVSFVHANFIYENDLILENTPTVNIDEFNKKVNLLGAELSQKTSWNIYLVLKKEIDPLPMLQYQQKIANELKAPYIILAIAHKEKRYGIYGSKGYREQFDIDRVKTDYIEPILGSKIKGDPRAKYLAAMYNGYTEIAEQIAEKNNVSLDNAIGSTNKNILSVLGFALMSVVVAVSGVLLYRKIFRRRQS